MAGLPPDDGELEKLNFYLFLGKVVAKIELSEITSFLYNNFFPVRGGGGLNPPNSPSPTPRTPRCGGAEKRTRQKSSIPEIRGKLWRYIWVFAREIQSNNLK